MCNEGSVNSKSVNYMYIYLPAGPGLSQQRFLRNHEGSEQIINTFGFTKKKLRNMRLAISRKSLSVNFFKFDSFNKFLSLQVVFNIDARS